MDPQDASTSQAQVEAFGRRHRTGLVTMLFTDMVGSTALKQKLGDHAGAQILERHHALVRSTLTEFPEGQELSTAGDSFFLVFATPSAGVKFALVLQQRLRELSRQAPVPVQDRMGLHLGEVLIQEADQQRTKDLIGLNVDLGARVMGLAQGGQILLTRAVFDSARQALKGEDIPGVGQLSWLNHGLYQLKGIEEAVEICEVGEVGAGPLRSPATTEKARRVEAAEGEAVLGWRPAVGQTVPNTQWVLEKKLGEGGFGEVWLGRHQKLKEQRVFKFCFRADRVRSLKREMTLFRVLKERVGDHPNIVRLLDVYFNEPPFYVVMDHVEGQDLASWCAAQGGADKVPQETRLEIVAQVADALQAAHDAGVIHRDVKPGNILVSGEWQVTSDEKEGEPRGVTPPRSSLVTRHSSLSAKLTDFGIGQVVSEEALKGVTKEGFTQTLIADSSSSQTGSQMYMAPELLAGKPASTRSDIYSLGVVLYQLLAGDFTRPVTTDWAKDIVDSLLREDLQHCFAGKPEDRFAGAGQLAGQLRGYEQRKAEQARQQAEAAERERLRRQVEHRHRVARVSTAAAGVLILLAVALGYGLARARAETLKARRTAYASDMNVAWRALKENNLGGVAWLLNAQRPRPGEQDLRNWEWRYLWQACRGEQLWTLDSLGASVVGLGLLPDGRLVTGSMGRGAVRICDPERREVVRLSTNINNVSGLAVSPDGRRIAVATWNIDVYFLDAKSLEVLGKFQHTSPVYKVVFSPDGQLVSAHGNEDVSVWEVATSKKLWATKTTIGGLSDAPFLKDGHSLVCTIGDGRLAVLDARGGRLLGALGRVDEMASTIAVSPDGRRLAAGTWSSRVLLTDLSTSHTRVLTNHTGPVHAVAFSPDGRQLASGGDDNIVKLWEVESGEERVSLRGHGKGIASLVYSTDGRRLFTGGRDGTVRAWDTRAKPRPATSVLPGGFFAVAVGPDGSVDRSLPLFGLRSLSRDGRYLAACSTNGLRRVLSLETFDQVGDVQSSGRFRCVSIRSDGREIAAGMTNGTVSVWDLVEGKVSWTFQAHSNEVDVLEFSPDGRRLATASRGAEIRLWNRGESQPVFTRVLGGTGYHVNDMAFTRDGSTLVVPAWGKIHLLSLRPGGRDRKIDADEIFCIDISRDGSLVAAGLGNGVRVWDLSSSRQVAQLRGSRGTFTGSVSFSPDGRRIVASDNQLVTWLWDLATGREVGRFFEGGQSLVFARFQPNGDTLVIASKSGVELLRVPTWAEIVTAEKAEAHLR